jgi:poly-gamma-glutamate synthesis protein (capsule biosynthesis protein)
VALLRRAYLAPVVDLLDPREDLAWKDLIQADPADTPPPPLLPFGDIALPQRALSVDGKHVDDPEYPLRTDTLLQLWSEDPTLLLWADGLPRPAPPPPSVGWIGAVGDLMLARGVDHLLLSHGPKEVFTTTLAELRTCNALLGNLEGAATTRLPVMTKAYTFKFDPRALAPMREAGFTYLSLTNNHSFDYRVEGFLDTLEHLQTAGIATSGAGPTLEQARRPAMIHLPSASVAVHSLGAYPVERSGFSGLAETAATPARPGVLWATQENLISLAASFSADVFDIVMVHGGREWQSEPFPGQMELYRRLVSEGADLVLGSHPHFLQGMEAFGNGLIVYSLGNFVFPGMQDTGYGEETILLRVGLAGGRIRYVEIVPARLEGRRVAADSRSGIRERFLRLSADLQSPGDP